MASQFPIHAVGLVLTFAVLAGCGDSSAYTLVPVSGVVTLDGEPVPYTNITFIPQGSTENPSPGPGSAASCDDQGRYQLTTVRGEPGAVVGPHSVVIVAHGPPRTTSGDQDIGPRPPELFPPQFNTNTTLTFDVPEDGTTTADFKLTTQ
jgi:hypothetical protein